MLDAVTYLLLACTREDDIPVGLYDEFDDVVEAADEILDVSSPLVQFAAETMKREVVGPLVSLVVVTYVNGVPDSVETLYEFTPDEQEIQN